jgi:hypothetical protein
MNTFLRLALLPVLVCGCSKANKLDGFEGDITMHTVQAGSSGSNSQDMVVEVKKDQLRFDMRSPQGGTMYGVFDPKANKVTFYSEATKTYTDLDFSGPSGKTNTNPDTSSIAPGKHETIAGYDCQDFTVNDPSGKKSEVCIAQGITFFDVAALRGGAPASGSALAAQFREKKSFPLKSIEYDATGKELSHMEVTKIEPKPIDDARFATPAGYTKINTSPKGL